MGDQTIYYVSRDDKWARRRGSPVTPDRANLPLLNSPETIRVDPYMFDYLSTFRWVKFEGQIITRLFIVDNDHGTCESVFARLPTLVERMLDLAELKQRTYCPAHFQADEIAFGPSDLSVAELREISNMAPPGEVIEIASMRKRQ